MIPLHSQATLMLCPKCTQIVAVQLIILSPFRHVGTKQHLGRAVSQKEKYVSMLTDTAEQKLRSSNMDKIHWTKTIGSRLEDPTRQLVLQRL